MTSINLRITANFRGPASLPSVEDQYRTVWQLVKTLSTVGMPLDEWYPPADTPEASRLNRAFDADGPTTAAIAMATEYTKQARHIRTLGAWNGKEVEGGCVVNATYDVGPLLSSIEIAAHSVASLADHRNVVATLRSIIEIWNPVIVEVGPHGYFDRQVFANRPGVGWMLYLARAISSKQVPEAADVIPVFDDRTNHAGTIILSVAETFDLTSREHVKRANAIEVRMVDQDLLPTNAEIASTF